MIEEIFVEVKKSISIMQVEEIVGSKNKVYLITDCNGKKYILKMFSETFVGDIVNKEEVMYELLHTSQYIKPVTSIGGFHMKNYRSCYILSIMTFVSIIEISDSMIVSTDILLFIGVFQILFISVNFWVRKQMTISFNLVSVFICAVIIWFYYLHQEKYMLVIVLSISVVEISRVIKVYLEFREKNKVTNKKVL